jgi:hypothetical protein
MFRNRRSQGADQLISSDSEKSTVKFGFAQALTVEDLVRDGTPLIGGLPERWRDKGRHPNLAAILLCMCGADLTWIT